MKKPQFSISAMLNVVLVVIVLVHTVNQRRLTQVVQQRSGETADRIEALRQITINLNRYLEANPPRRVEETSQRIMRLETSVAGIEARLVRVERQIKRLGATEGELP